MITIYLKKTFAFLILYVLCTLFRKRIKGSNLIFFSNGFLGDQVIASLILFNEKIMARFPECYYVVNKEYEQLFEGYTGNIKIIYLNTADYRYKLTSRINFVTKIRKLNISTAVNLSFARRIIDDEITFLSGAAESIAFENTKSKYKLYNKYIEKKYTRVIPRKSNNDFEDLYSFLKEFSGRVPERRYFIAPDFGKNINLQNLRGKIPGLDSRKIIFISPFSSSEIKNWSFENYISLSEKLTAIFPEVIILLTGENHDKSLVKSSKTNRGIINLVGLLSLSEICFLISKTTLFIGNDSGLFHVAKVYNIPRIGIIGGGSYKLIHPYGNLVNEKLLYMHQNCFGCNWTCIKDEPFCLTRVSVSNVLAAVQEFL